MGIDPRAVKILGLNGGDIAAVEFRISLGLGASVAVLESGREATKLLKDEVWAVSETLLPMPTDPQTVRAFIGPGVPPLHSVVRDEMAKRIHNYHREQTVYTQPTWEELVERKEERKQKNSRSQAEHNIVKLRAIGCKVCDRPPTELFMFADEEVKDLAEMEHGRWNAELLMDGWRVGDKKDEEARTHHLLVAWEELTDEQQEWDRNFVLAIPEILASVNMDIREIQPPLEPRPPREPRVDRCPRCGQERPGGS